MWGPAHARSRRTCRRRGPTLEAAKADFEASWRKWLAWAKAERDGLSRSAPPVAPKCLSSRRHPVAPSGAYYAGRRAPSSLAFSRTSSSRRPRKPATSTTDIPRSSEAVKKNRSLFSHDLPAFVSKCIEDGTRGDRRTWAINRPIHVRAIWGMRPFHSKIAGPLFSPELRISNPLN